MLYWLLQLIGWGVYTSATYFLIAQRADAQHEALFNALVISAGGLIASHSLRWRLKSHPLTFESLFKSIAYYFLLLVLATLFWLGIILLVLLTFMASFEISALNGFVLTYYFGIYFMVLLIWLLMYLGYHSHLLRRQQEIETLKLQVALQEAQLQGLKFQMNPHFLFNALNAIRTLALVSPEQTRDMVSRLSMMLRYTLTSGEKQWVSLSQELELVQHYLAIEQVRFEERLEVQWDVAEQALPFAVLPMSIQTLVENSVKHGIATLHEGGCIMIRAWVNDELLQIEVTNPGMLQSEINESVGLRNTKERLALMFAEQASFSLQQHQDKVVASVILPLLRIEDETEGTDS